MIMNSDHEQEHKLSKDNILTTTIGDFGKWQLKISILMALVKFPIAWFQMSIVFLAPPLTFWCQKWGSFENITDAEWRDLIRPDDESSKHIGINTGYCHMKNIVSNETSKGTVQCLHYSYDKSMFSSTITSEWDLVCERQKLIDLSQITLMMGVLLGNIIFGILADKKGRQKILIICLFFQAFFCFTASFATSIWLFILIRFCLALANGGTMVTSFVICIEVVGGKWRTIVPVLYQIPFGIGNALLSGFAFYLRDWRSLHMLIGSLSMLYVAIYRFVPESPRWLLTVGRQEEAIVVMTNAAKENGVKASIEEPLKTLINTSRSSNNTLKDMFSNAALRVRCLLLFLSWSLAGVTFYAFLQYVGHISQNLFLTVALGSLSSLPGTIICVFLISRYGRKPTIISSFLVTALCSLLILSFPKGFYILDWPRVALTGLATIGLSISIPAMYLFTGELFPTTLRNSGVGMSMMFSRLGSMVAPLVVSLQDTAGFLPLLVIGGVTLLQAALVAFLPEVREGLPDTVQDVKGGGIVMERNGCNKESTRVTADDIIVY
ncbi:organic cation transporter protein-like [Euwallacea fornicatus]|uniref:organic cation transporter protein-like n=1 Tax=Euwallacea fornicatus TaxID=995702 RepID=UPI00338DC591